MIDYKSNLFMWLVYMYVTDEISAIDDVRKIEKGYCK